MNTDAQTLPDLSGADPEEMKMLMDIFGGTGDPSDAFARLRETRPVAHVPLLGLWLVSRYDDCIRVIRDVESFGCMPADMLADPPEELRDELPDGYPSWFPGLINTDPPIHTRFRKLAQKPVTPRMVLAREADVRATAHSVIDQFVAQGRADMVRSFALPFTIAVLADLLGVPRSDQEKFERWVSHTTELFSPAVEPDRRLALSLEQVEFGSYIAQAISDRRRNPSTDLISELLTVETGGELALTDREVHGIISAIMLGGFDSTAGAICFALAHVCSDRGLYDRVRADPSLLPTVVEETVRRSTPVRGVVREAKHNVELGGTIIPTGARVMALVPSANQDPAQFSCPHAFDIDRDPSELRRHIGFGQGIHKCLGQPIAQLEIRLSLETLLERLPNLRLVTEDMTLSPGMIFLRPSELEVAWDPA